MVLMKQSVSMLLPYEVILTFISLDLDEVIICSRRNETHANLRFIDERLGHFIHFDPCLSLLIQSPGSPGA